MLQPPLPPPPPLLPPLPPSSFAGKHKRALRLSYISADCLAAVQSFEAISNGCVSLHVCAIDADKTHDGSQAVTSDSHGYLNLKHCIIVIKHGNDRGYFSMYFFFSKQFLFPWMDKVMVNYVTYIWLLICGVLFLSRI